MCKRQEQRDREKRGEGDGRKRCGVIYINVFVCLCACKLSGKIKTSQNKIIKKIKKPNRHTGRQSADGAETEKG